MFRTSCKKNYGKLNFRKCLTSIGLITLLCLAGVELETGGAICSKSVLILSCSLAVLLLGVLLMSRLEVSLVLCKTKFLSPSLGLAWLASDNLSINKCCILQASIRFLFTQESGVYVSYPY